MNDLDELKICVIEIPPIMEERPIKNPIPVGKTKPHPLYLFFKAFISAFIRNNKIDRLV